MVYCICIYIYIYTHIPYVICTHMHLSLSIYIYTHMCIYLYIYIYIERERDIYRSVYIKHIYIYIYILHIHIHVHTCVLRPAEWASPPRPGMFAARRLRPVSLIRLIIPAKIARLTTSGSFHSPWAWDARVGLKTDYEPSRQSHPRVVWHQWVSEWVSGPENSTPYNWYAWVKPSEIQDLSAEIGRTSLLTTLVGALLVRDPLSLRTNQERERERERER